MKESNRELPVLYLVVPCYNEEAIMLESAGILKAKMEELISSGSIEKNSKVLFVNDGSKDNTWEILSTLQANYPHLTPLNKPNSGHGATVLYTYRYAIENGANYIFQTDSDGQTLPEEFWPMWESRSKASFI